MLVAFLPLNVLTSEGVSRVTLEDLVDCQLINGLVCFSLFTR